MRKLFLASLFLAPTVFAQENPSAYEALRVVGTQVSRDALDRIVSVSGVDGDPQPRKWKILVSDRQSESGVREITVEDNQIKSQRLPNRSITGSANGATIKTSRLNLDSTGVYTVASHTADTAHVTFTYVDYMLRTDERGNPVWVVTLEDRSRRPVGTIHIKAHDGRVSRVEGMYHGRNLEQVEGEQDVAGNENVDPEEDPDENIVKRRVKQFFRKTQADARDLFVRCKRSFVDYVNRW